MERFYQIAGVRYRLLIPDSCHFPDAGVLADFTADAPGWDHTLEILLTDRLSGAGGRAGVCRPGEAGLCPWGHPVPV